MVRESRLRFCFPGFFSRSYWFFMSRRILVLSDFMGHPPVICVVPLFLKVVFVFDFMGFSFIRIGSFVSRKIILPVFDFMGYLSMVRNVPLVIQSRLRICFLGFPFSRVDSLCLEKSFSCLVLWILFR